MTTLLLVIKPLSSCVVALIHLNWAPAAAKFQLHFRNRQVQFLSIMKKKRSCIRHYMQDSGGIVKNYKGHKYCTYDQGKPGNADNNDPGERTGGGIDDDSGGRQIHPQPLGQEI